ncbi:hypothetical protein V5O48_015474 [Marasmius crinis-equi]|uniref:Uncharacterized protein n=1 Tax=Marasmius crinis-equi TaxID=585013 RepID=A0ABR3EUF7_9AGAR
MQANPLQPFYHEKTRCLRLQHLAERRWLLLRGCPESSLDEIIEARREFRAETLNRYENRLDEELEKRQRASKRVRRFERLLAEQPKTWIARNAQDRSDWARWKDTADAEQSAADAEVKWLSGVVNGLSPWEKPDLIIRKTRILRRTSEAVKEAVARMADSVATPV